MSGCNFADLPHDVLVRVFQLLTEIRDLCVASEVCTSWSNAALSGDCWCDVSAVDILTRRRMLNMDNSSPFTHSCDDYLDQPYSTPCRDCMHAAPAKIAHKRQRKRRRVDCKHTVGVKCAVDVITRRAGSRLRSLDLRLCFPFHHVPSYQMHNSDLDVIAGRCGQRLRQFSVSPSVHVLATALVSFANACPQLRKLHMTDCQNLTTSHVNSIVQACPQLEDISVSRCPRFRGQRLMQILLPLKETLRRIDISFTPSEMLDVSLAMTFPVLEEIIADHCSHLRGTIPVFNPDGYDPPKKSTCNLKTLRMDDTLFDASMFLPLFQRCPHLQCLSTNHLPLSLRRPLDNALGSAAPPLRTLCVAAIPVSDRTWTRIYENLRTTLEFCDVSGNLILTLDVPFEKGDFEKLEGIYLRNCALTDRTLGHFLMHTPRLDIIDATGCRGVVSRRFRRDPLQFRSVMHKIAAGENPDS